MCVLHMRVDWYAAGWFFWESAALQCVCAWICVDVLYYVPVGSTCLFKAELAGDVLWLYATCLVIQFWIWILFRICIICIYSNSLSVSYIFCTMYLLCHPVCLTLRSQGCSVWYTTFLVIQFRMWIMFCVCITCICNNSLSVSYFWYRFIIG